MSSMRMYTFRDTLNLSPVESSWTPSPEPLFKDAHITVYGIPILPSVRPTLLPPTLAYVVVGPRIRGKFNAKAAEELGVPSGPLRAQLTRGNSVTVKSMVDGEMVERTVRPEDCIGESESPGVVIILDIPTVEHIPALIAAFKDPFYAKFRSHRPEDLQDHAVRSVFHLLGKDVLEEPRYIEFMDGFSPNTHHVISSREHSPDPVTFTSAAFSQLRMNRLDSDMFPIPHYSLSPKRDLNSIPNLPKNSSILSAGLEVNMRNSNPPTSRELDDSFHKTVTSDKPIVLSQGTSMLFAKAKEDIEAHVSSGKLRVPPGSDVKVISLGTGSALPTKYRNVSSTLVQIPNWGNILLDAGEGTWGQLARQFGIDDGIQNNVWDVLRNLKCIYVSHIHGDHHMGLAELLAKRRQLDPPASSPVYLVSIRSVHLYLREVSEIQDLGLDDPSGNGVIPILSESIHWKNPGVYQNYGIWQVGGSEPWTDINLSLKNVAALREALGLESINTVDVRHRTRCYGVVIKHRDGWSIVFSGDTAPTSSLAYAGKDATLLIHEATMADDQEQLAAKKAHSTFGQALDVGRHMRAEHILLTHFSARYPRMPPSALQHPRNGDFRPIVALAFDHANFRIQDMWKTSYYLEALEQSFQETLAEEGDAEDEEAEASALAGMDVAVD
ncbi:hypothetical protein C0993_006239 [Termitomyces sp. T159_Od127]|nr:hypothetical protein C0993_006239 [Termitomyces sp. T159_Od127]